MPSVRFEVFPDRQAASDAAAVLLAEGLAAGLAGGGRASLVVSGGSTPGPCFNTLSHADLDFSRVDVVPSDERWVPADHPDSNERLVREQLLRHAAAPANYVSLVTEHGLPEPGLPEVSARLAAMTRPLDAVLLGMGGDGHFASLFPDFDGLAAGLDPQGEALCLAVRTAASPHPRISLSLSLLLDARGIVILMFGEDKRRVFEAAAAGQGNYPVAALLGQSRTPVTIAWAA